MSSERPARFTFAPGLGLEVWGSEAVRRHFAAEYGAAAASDGTEAGVVVHFGAAARGVSEERYKSVGWRIGLGDPDERPLRAWVEVRGRPRAFALSMLQGYLVEPLLALAAARADTVLLPSAAIESEGGAMLLLGRSRSGKSSLCARALVAGRRILGDDHVLLDGDGHCRAFPRRLRVYSDLEETAPDARRRLSAAVKAALGARALVRTLTRGYIAPPLRLRVDQLGRPVPEEPLALVRVVAIVRDPDARDLVQSDLALNRLVELAQTIADEQRRHLIRGPKAEAWRGALAASREAEQELLLAGLRQVPAQKVVLPEAWSAARSVNALGLLLRIDD